MKLWVPPAFQRRTMLLKCFHQRIIDFSVLAFFGLYFRFIIFLSFHSNKLSNWWCTGGSVILSPLVSCILNVSFFRTLVCVRLTIDFASDFQPLGRHACCIIQRFILDQGLWSWHIQSIFLIGFVDVNVCVFSCVQSCSQRVFLFPLPFSCFHLHQDETTGALKILRLCRNIAGTQPHFDGNFSQQNLSESITGRSKHNSFTVEKDCRYISASRRRSGQHRSILISTCEWFLYWRSLAFKRSWQRRKREEKAARKKMEEKPLWFKDVQT